MLSIRLIELSTESRCDGSPSSKSKRILRDPVGAGLVLHETMLTWCVGQRRGHVAQQPRRSSALTSMTATKVPRSSSSHSTSIRRSAWPLQRHGVGAVGAVHRHAAATGDEADDLVARHRRAAPRQAHHARRRGPRRARPSAAPPLPAPAVLAHGDGQLLLALGVAARWSGDARARPPLGRHVVLADGRLERVEVGVVERCGDLVEHRRLQDLLDGQALAAQRPVQVVLAALDGVLARAPARTTGGSCWPPGG